MSVLSPRNRLIAWLALAGVGLVLFFSGEYRDLGLPLGWFGSVLFIASVWFAVDAVHRLPRSDDEGTLAPGEWQAWVGLAFATALVVAMLGAAEVFRVALPIGENPDAGRAGTKVGTLFVAWLVLSHVLRQRWSGRVLADERDARIEAVACEWGRWATVACVIGIAVLLGFSETARLRELSYPFIAHLLMTTLVWGLWVEQAVIVGLYWRDRRA